MNERIKELYSGAVEYAFGQRFIPGNPRPLQEVINEKFAELIVKECINKVDEVGYKSSNNISSDDTELFKGVLKSHFGIKTENVS